MATNPNFYNNLLQYQPSQIPQPGSPSASVNMTGAFNQTLPGFQGLSSSASDIVGNLLKGLPSAGPARRANAYFGVGSGMPGSDFVRNRGFDLYGEDAEKRRQLGMDSFLKLIQGFSGTVLPTAGQTIEGRQFDQRMNRDIQQQNIENAVNAEKEGFDRLKWGAGRPWDSFSTGEVQDRLGRRLPSDARYRRSFF